MLDFLGIGAQKAGTTWLYEQLRTHPRVEFPGRKEIHFWDRGGDLDEYRSLFDGPDDGTRRGEITPAYAFLPQERIDEIARLFPHLRMIYVLRNPIDRAWSHSLMKLRHTDRPVDETPDDWFIEHAHSEHSMQRGDYLTCLRRWTTAFPEDRTLVERFESITDEPRSLLARCASHLGVEPEGFDAIPDDDLGRTVRPGPGLDIRPAVRMVLDEIYAPKIEALAAHLGWDLTAWMPA